MKIDTVRPKDDAPVVEESKTRSEYENSALIVDKYIMGEPVEKTVMLKKIKIILRAPSVGVVNKIYREVAKESRDNYVDMQVESSARMISAYVREYNGIDFLELLGDEFNTIEGKQKIRERMDELLIEPVRDALSEEVFRFYDEVKAAFTDESLDFSSARPSDTPE